MEKKVTDFDSITIKLASPEKILSWSRGEVTKPETINYRTQRSERNGLFDERIFGPEKDFECYCGKYRRIRYKGIICEKCGVEVTRSIVRRERMGHIELAVPVAHIWFVRNVPSRIGMLLNLPIADLEKVIYFAGYIITSVNSRDKDRVKINLEKEYKVKLKNKNANNKEELKKAYMAAKSELEILQTGKVLSEVDYHNLSLRYGELFEVETGSGGLYNICKKIDLKKLKEKIESSLGSKTSPDYTKKLRRLRLVKMLDRAGVRPEWMFLKVIPVTPPALRPMVPLDGGRHATSDVNDLYRRVINRNNRLKKLIELSAPEVICRNEKRILQEAVDALIDNSIRRSQKAAISQAQRRPLKSLADMLRGKQGRFRQNLLGKRVDYSARSVIVVGPELKLHQCGLPKIIALELFRPFVIAKLISGGLSFNIRGSNRLIDEKTSEVWAILENVIREKYVLLNRAPTLHRLGIQAFQPILIEGSAIQLHPLVCSAFNADFDGDQMAVHLPLSPEAQKEAKEIMLSSKNLLSPGDGRPIVQPSNDIVLGCYWMTQTVEGGKGEGSIFSSPNESITAYDFDKVDFRAQIKVLGNSKKYKKYEGKLMETTVGRVLFNSILPSDFAFINEEMNKKRLSQVVSRLILHYGEDKTPDILDKIKNFGYKYATKAGISWGYGDLTVPSEKTEIVKSAKEEINILQNQHKEGLLTDNEKYQKTIEIWEEVRNKIAKFIPLALDKFGPVNIMVSSGARGNWVQVNQMAGMRGQVVNPAGRIIDIPILSSYKEGLSVLEYFISTHGARKGLADTALKTAKAGYLTRRLVDVAQDMIVSEDDCKTTKGILVRKADLIEYNKHFTAVLGGRILISPLEVEFDGEKRFFKKNHMFTSEDLKFLENSDFKETIIRSPITCETVQGICKFCYGKDLGRNKLVELGVAVGVVAAQAIGEPGTQLTMRTKHTGGVAGTSDITQGLPRVEEIFELVKPKSQAVISEIDGTIAEIKEKDNERIIVVKEKEHSIPFGRNIWVKIGDSVKVGEPLTDGAMEIKELFKIAGSIPVQNYILNEIDKVYSSQGITINSKHIEVIISKMFSRYKINSEGDTVFNRGQIVEKMEFLEENERVKGEGGKQAEVEKLIMGIKKVALTTASFLSAASFQDTNKVLISAALQGAEDKLRGLKENVMIGRLIPAGTGFRKKEKEPKEKEPKEKEPENQK